MAAPHSTVRVYMACTHAMYTHTCITLGLGSSSLVPHVLHFTPLPTGFKGSDPDAELATSLQDCVHYAVAQTLARINVHYAVAQTLANKCYVDNIYSQVSVRILQDCNFASAFISLGLSESQREDDTAAAIVMQQPTGGRAQYFHPYRREQSHNEGQCCKGVKCLGGCQHLCVRVQFV